MMSSVNFSDYANTAVDTLDNGVSVMVNTAKQVGIASMPIEMLRKIPCDVLQGRFSEQERIDIANRLVDYFQNAGFPYYNLSDGETADVLDKMVRFDVSSLELPDNVLEQNMLGLNLANSFHPQMWSTRCRNQKTPFEVFSDKRLFRDALLKRMALSDTPLADFNLRKSLKIFSGVQSVSNFRPTIAKWVYERFGNGGDVLDPCAGYGGRLVGAFSSSISSYVGVDPSTKSYDGNSALAEALVRAQTTLNRNTMFPRRPVSVRLVCSPFEDVQLANQYSLVFTSPPYFDIEKYSDELTQSYLRYPTYAEWVLGFLNPLVLLSHKALTTGGYFAVNVAGGELVSDLRKIADNVFGQPTTYYMRLSKVLGNGKKAEQSHKLEPIFVWMKQ